MHITQVMVGVHLHVPTCRGTLFRILETAGRIGFAVRDPLAWRFIKVNGGAQVCTRAHPIFRISKAAGRIALKVGVGGPLATRFTQNGGYPHVRTCNCAHI